VSGLNYPLTGVSDVFIPARSRPSGFPCVLSALEVLVGPQVVAHVHLTNVREESTHRGVVLLSVFESPGPVVPPLYRGTRLQSREIHCYKR